MANLNEIYSKLKNYFTHHNIIKIDKSLIDIINEEAIMMDEETKNKIDNEIKTKINSIIQEFDYVFVKLNKNAGTDAEFMCTQLKCFNIEDIITLIKGSKKIMDDFDASRDNFLIIKEWYKIEHKNEFRCFFVNKDLKAICQRYVDTFENYEADFIKEVKSAVKALINEKEFIESINSFFSEEYPFCIVDLVYLPTKKKVKLIDVEFFQREKKEEDYEKNKLLFYSGWEEISNLESSEDVPFKYIESETDPNIKKYPDNENMFPLELYETDIETLISKLNTT